MDVFSPVLEYLQDPQSPIGLMDLVYGAYLLIAFVRGCFRGLPDELSRLVGTLLIWVCAHRFYAPVSRFLLEHTRLESQVGSRALAYALLILVLFAAWRLLTFLVHKALDWSCPRQIRRIGGGLAGAAKSLLVLWILLGLVALSEHEELNKQMIQRSAFGRFTQRVVTDKMRDRLPALFPPAAETPAPAAPHGS